VTDAVREKLLTPKRLTMILEALIDRQAAKDASVISRRSALEAEIGDIGDKLARLYRAIEEGAVEIDDQLKARIAALKSARELAQASLERIAAQAAASRALTPDRIAAFGEMLRQKIETADIQARKAYLNAVISEIRVGDDKIQIIGDNLGNGHTFEAGEQLFKMALRAQSQCRATLETLATVKNPPVVFAKQANIANGPQQVNNNLNAASHAGEKPNTPNELLEQSNEQPLDTGAPGATSACHSPLEAVGAVHRAKKSRG